MIVKENVVTIGVTPCVCCRMPCACVLGDVAVCEHCAKFIKSYEEALTLDRVVSLRPDHRQVEPQK